MMVRYYSRFISVTIKLIYLSRWSVLEGGVAALVKDFMMVRY